MNIQEEKKFIYEMMKDITNERRKLTDIYYGLKERLDFLHIQEQKGLEDLSLSGYTNLFNETQKQIAVTNIKREADFLVEKISNNNIEESGKIEETQSIIREKEIIKDNETKKKSRYLNTDKVISNIVMVLKDAGQPLKIKELYNRLVIVMPDEKIDYKNFQNNIIKRAKERNNKIEMPMRGFYQYRGF